MVATLLKRSMLLEVGLFDPNFFNNEDEHLRARIRSFGWLTGYCKTTNIFHYQGASFQSILQREENKKKYQESIKRFFNTFTPDFLDKYHHATVKERNDQPFE
jgi:GT2 family glycosyltransferase